MGNLQRRMFLGAGVGIALSQSAWAETIESPGTFAEKVGSLYNDPTGGNDVYKKLFLACLSMALTYQDHRYADSVEDQRKISSGILAKIPSTLDSRFEDIKGFFPDYEKGLSKLFDMYRKTFSDYCMISSQLVLKTFSENGQKKYYAAEGVAQIANQQVATDIMRGSLAKKGNSPDIGPNP